MEGKAPCSVLICSLGTQFTCLCVYVYVDGDFTNEL